MLNRMLICALAALFCLAGQSRSLDAQIKKPMVIGIAAGLTLPTGDFSDAYDAGYNLTGSLLFQRAASPLSFKLDGMFNSFEAANTTTATTKVIALTGNVILSGSSVLGPYLIGGGGLYAIQRPDVGSRFPGGDETQLGGNIGGGFRFSLSGFDAFAEIRYHAAGDKEIRFAPLTFGVLF